MVLCALLTIKLVLQTIIQTHLVDHKKANALVNLLHPKKLRAMFTASAVDTKTISHNLLFSIIKFWMPMQRLVWSTTFPDIWPVHHHSSKSVLLKTSRKSAPISEAVSHQILNSKPQPICKTFAQISTLECCSHLHTFKIAIKQEKKKDNFYTILKRLFTLNVTFLKWGFFSMDFILRYFSFFVSQSFLLF